MRSGSDPPPGSPGVPPVRFVRANTKVRLEQERGIIGSQRVSPRGATSPIPSPQRSPLSSPRGGPVRPTADAQSSRPGSSDTANADLLSVVAVVYDEEEDKKGGRAAWRRSLVAGATAPGAAAAEEDAGAAANNQLYAWGWRDGAVPVPVPLAVLRAGESVVAVSTGAAHVVALTDARRVFTWGRGAQGQLGHGDVVGCDTPRLVEMLDGSAVTRIAAGACQTAAAAGAEFFVWGAVGPGDKPRSIPTAVEGLRGVPLRDVAVGASHVLVCTAAGDLLGWGHNELGQLGANLPEQFYPAPVEVDSSKRVAAVVAGDGCSACLLHGAQVMVWGSNWLRGRPGVGTKPLRVSFPRPVTQIALGERHLLAVSAHGEVFSLGYGQQGQLGNGKLAFSSEVSTVAFAEGVTLETAAVPVAAASVAAAAAAAPDESELRRNILAAFRPLKRREESGAGGGASVVIKCVQCGPTYSVALSDQGTLYYWGTSPLAAGTIALPAVVGQLSSLSCGVVSAGAAGLVTLVDLQNTADLKFVSFSPPILKACSSYATALEFFASPKGQQSPLLDFILGTTWPSMCEAPECFAALQSVWSTAGESSGPRLQVFTRNLVSENAWRFASSSVAGVMCEWLATVVGQDEVAKLLKTQRGSGTASAPQPGEPAPALVDLASYSAEAIAEQLTLIDHQNLAAIRLSELLAWAKNDKSSVALQVFTARFNELAAFVRADIVSGLDLATRNRRLKLWVEVQKQLFNLNNFNGAMALCAALGSVPLKKLAKAAHGLEFSRAQRRWTEFFEETMLKSNRSGYRKKLAAVVAARESGVPFLGCAMSDLVFIADGNPDTLEDGRLINFWKRYQQAKVLHYVNHFKRTLHSALRKEADLFAFLSVCKSDLDDKRCDELVDAIVKQTALGASGPVSSSLPPAAAVTAAASAAPVLESSSDRFLSLIEFASADNVGSPTEKRKQTHTGAELADPERRCSVWGRWVATYIAAQADFAAAWCREQHLENTVCSLLRVPVQEHERAVLETLFVFVLAPGTNVPLLLELLQAVAATDPGAQARENVLRLFASLRRFERASGENRAVASAACEQLRAAYAAVVPRSTRELAQFREERSAGEAARAAQAAAAEREAAEQAQLLAALAAREAELRRQLAQATRERLQAEEEGASRRREAQARLQELGRRVAVLDANACALEMDVEAAERVLAALAAVARDEAERKTGE